MLADSRLRLGRPCLVNFSKEETAFTSWFQCDFSLADLGIPWCKLPGVSHSACELDADVPVVEAVCASSSGQLDESYGSAGQSEDLYGSAGQLV